ncbi:MAG: tetratricopeptide repeat protein [Deltaproteobacteria bacterium]|nr:tetratricopeptide repeat protein [Deltaproteobacteria bacterium]
MEHDKTRKKRPGYLWVTCFVVLCTNCMSTADVDDLRDQVFRAQKQLLELETKITKSEEQGRNDGSSTRQKLASSSLRLNELETSLRHIQGSVDTLRQGVITGELPGMEGQPDSVAKGIRRLEERLTELEKTQVEILTLLDQKHSLKAKKKQRKDLKNVRDLRSAFNNKQFLYVVEDGPQVLKSASGKASQNEISFLIAESQFRLGRLRDAALSFKSLTSESLPDKAPHIALRLGDCFRLLGDKKAASLFYQDVSKKYPESEEAVSAQKQLRKTTDEQAQN